MTIIAAVDRSKWAQTVLEEARKLADLTGEELHIVHVLTESEAADVEMDNVQKTGQAKGRDGIAEIAADIALEATGASTDDFTSVGFIGDPADEIVKYADKQNARYIVVGGRKRSPIGKAVFGSVAQSVLLNSECPVVVAPKTVEKQ
ncbi:universal stress protein [Halostella sp. JP-L12]|uniref:universal stress protein n=1 Tax=Halostella TaxID=1843185 RepID=UPI000EF7B832|nr:MULTISPECIES: universal stress protein [Halostella]NHN48072.1 universal stress protein [Halostella sp. JP-L12]